jgi:hypothetical protein
VAKQAQSPQHATKRASISFLLLNNNAVSTIVVMVVDKGDVTRLEQSAVIGEPSILPPIQLKISNPEGDH